MDIALIQGTISSLKLAGDIAKSLLDLKTLSEVQGKVIELQSTILSAQSSAMAANAAQAAMVEEIRALKEEITRMKTWDTQKKRYKLYEPWKGAVTYALKESMSEGEPPHWICTKCYEEGRKSIINQRQSLDDGVFSCPVCKAEIVCHGWKSPEVKYAAE